MEKIQQVINSSTFGRDSSKEEALSNESDEFEEEEDTESHLTSSAPQVDQTQVAPLAFQFANLGPDGSFCDVVLGMSLLGY